MNAFLPQMARLTENAATQCNTLAKVRALTAVAAPTLSRYLGCSLRRGRGLGLARWVRSLERHPREL